MVVSKAKRMARRTNSQMRERRVAASQTNSSTRTCFTAPTISNTFARPYLNKINNSGFFFLGPRIKLKEGDQGKGRHLIFERETAGGQGVGGGSFLS